MLDQKTLHAALKKVSAAMMHLENTGFEEKYPIGLIDINLWEWPQGVGLYGLYNYYKLTGDRGTFDFLCGWYDARMAEGLPERNVNTTCPMLTLLCVYEDTQDERYGALCRDWAEWVMHGLIRTGDGAFQHMITGDANDSQMLIDTLFMTVLFLAKAGVVFGRKDYVEEAKRQCLVHIKYLYDTSCGLYFHGYDFKGRHNYGRVHWARGNSWYTCGIMEMIGLIPIEPGLRQYFLDTFRAQVDALCACQAGDGMWHTILDDPASYKESSATAAFAYGMLKGVRLGFLPAQYEAPALRAVQAVLARVDAAGIVGGVSYGTPVGNDAQFYKDIPVCPMTYGQAMAILMLAEALYHTGEDA